MKKFLGIMLSFVMAFSLFSFVGCDSATPDLSALENKIAELEDKLSKVPDYKGEIDTLKGTITTLNSTISALQTALGTADENLQKNIDKLKADLDKATARVQILEGINSGENEQKIYEVGVKGKDTFTFVNNGIKLFTVTLNEYVSKNGANIGLHGTITNHNMPSNIDGGMYFGVYIYYTFDNQTTFTSSQNMTSLQLDLETPKSFSIQFNNYPTFENVTGFYIGIPNQDPSKSSLIPYAKFIL